MFIGMNVYDA